MIVSENILNNTQTKKFKKKRKNLKIQSKAHTNAAPASPPPQHDLHK